LRKLIIFLFLTFFLFTCQKPIIVNSSTQSVDQIGKVQSDLVTLTVECEKGDPEACDKVPGKKKELEVLLNQPKNKPYQLKRHVLDQK